MDKIGNFVPRPKKNLPKEIGVAKDGFCILTTCINRKFNKIPYVPHVRVRPEGAGLKSVITAWVTENSS